MSTDDQSPDGDASPGRRSRRRKTSPEPTPNQRALSLLVRREHSRKELTRKLCVKGVPRSEAKAAVAYMTEAGWQSDERFAENLVRSRAAQGQGPLRIRAEMSSHGLDETIIGAALACCEEDWSRLAFNLVQRRFGPGLAEDRELQRKAAGFLLRRGFSMEQMRRATQSSEFDEFFEEGFL
ncbi:regulatory protein RecX [Solilutibacter pythonis]|uniref:regulatory protein RecX n=1 Tax=Solilutibacter pythonis TaxID=2483112 RepID=UPI001FE777B0|nr:regulatory protein RecX [Lysobacter pythonis]